MGFQGFPGCSGEQDAREMYLRLHGGGGEGVHLMLGPLDSVFTSLLRAEVGKSRDAQGVSRSDECHHLPV